MEQCRVMSFFTRNSGCLSSLLPQAAFVQGVGQSLWCLYCACAVFLLDFWLRACKTKPKVNLTQKQRDRETERQRQISVLDFTREQSSCVYAE
ncbi:hypothetical protein AOLI_G00189120 [Acnodon oligacanthus]